MHYGRVMGADATSNVLNAALKLPARDRAAIALGLLESLDDDDHEIPEEEWEQSWAVEVRRRLDELDTGAASEVEAFAAIERVRAELH